MIRTPVTSFFAAFLTSALLAGSAARAEDAAVLVAYPAWMDAVREDIAANWNIVYDQIEECPEPFTLRVGLKAGGEVVNVTPEHEPRSKACAAAVERARRAVVMSSPLPVPDDFTAIDLVFDAANTAVE
jgi:hypothetical protein